MNKQGKLWLPHIFIAGILLAGITSSAPAQESGISWAGTWASPPVQGDATHNPGNRTLRQIVHTSVGGSRARVQISNLFGTQPLRIEDVHIAQKGNGSSIVPGTDRQIRFHGQTAVTIAPATAAISDPVPYAVPSLSDVAISLIRILQRTTPIIPRAFFQPLTVAITCIPTMQGLWQSRMRPALF
jgi:hypothetical protein